MMNATRDFANVLLERTKHDLWIQSLPNEKDAGSGRHVRTRDVGRILWFCAKHDVQGEGVYYCVSSIRGTRRNLESIGETPILWFDLDYKDVKATPEECLTIIRSMVIPPTRIHATGNGLHGIYVLDKPWDQKDDGDIRLTLRRLADVVGGDRKVCHPAALMRMPGTHNSKRGERKLVELLT